MQPCSQGQPSLAFQQFKWYFRSLSYNPKFRLPNYSGVEGYSKRRKTIFAFHCICGGGGKSVAPLSLKLTVSLWQLWRQEVRSLSLSRHSPSVRLLYPVNCGWEDFNYCGEGYRMYSAEFLLRVVSVSIATFLRFCFTFKERFCPHLGWQHSLRS